MSVWPRDIARLVRRICRKLIAEVQTHEVAQVVSYTAATNTCSIQLCINAIRTDDANNLTTVQLPVIEDVPVKQFGSGKCLLSVAPQPGSYGIYHVSKRSLEQWMVSGGIVDPGSARQFDLSSGHFDPGVYPLISDGDNGLIVPPIDTDRIALRTRLGTTYVSVTDAGDVEISALSVGLITVEGNGTITVENALGNFSLDGTTGQFDANGNFTVDP